MNDYEYELAYKQYYIEKEYLDSISRLSNECKTLNEGYLTEADTLSIKDKLMKYAKKMVDGVQSAWNKFKEKIQVATWEEIKEKYGKQFTIEAPLNITEVGDNDKLPGSAGNLGFEKLDNFIKIPNGALTIDKINEPYENKTALLHFHWIQHQPYYQAYLLNDPWLWKHHQIHAHRMKQRHHYYASSHNELSLYFYQ